ncbi:MAG: hypothetical protein IBJ03_05480 [Gemmatimonadaceae bacterium]|nr:hypothetical protein [Gemmatimonadaceae bacterium]
MIEQASPERILDFQLGPDRTAFLASHRAHSVALREFTRFTETVVKAAKAIATEAALEPPVMRMSPERCIVQIGPVALTAAHIKNGSDVPLGGQLLAIVWHGTIAPRGEHIPERNGFRGHVKPPEQIWEESCVVSADNENNWHWHPNGLEKEGYTSTELAERCLAQLSQALETHRPDADLKTERA